eukprot:5769453-Pyramimonas_sp.AAC.1
MARFLGMAGLAGWAFGSSFTCSCVAGCSFDCSCGSGSAAGAADCAGSANRGRAPPDAAGQELLAPARILILW